MLFRCDLWINLPVVTDHPILGIDGALANATLWAVGNQQRFFNSPASAASAAAEIAAIPEYRRTYGFSLLSFEAFQYIGGPQFNSRYTTSRPAILLSRDMVALDRIALYLINIERVAAGFDPILPGLQQFSFAESLGLGSAGITRERLTGDPSVLGLGTANRTN